jgi:uncharacterized membrane protein
MSLFRVLATCMVLCVFSAMQLQAQKATCTNWNLWLLNPKDPNDPRIGPVSGVNDNRTVVGTAAYNFNKPNIWGFVHYLNGNVTYWHPANAKQSSLEGRNNLGNTAGNYLDTQGIWHAAYLHGSTTTLIAHPKAAQHSTYLVGINNLNTVLGSYKDSVGRWHNFKRRSDGTFLSVPNFPGAMSTSASGFNDNGVVVGWYVLPTDPFRVTHGYIYRNGTFATLNYRNQMTSTSLVGISNNGMVVGNHYFNDGFLYVNGVFKNIWGPNGEHATVRGISANGTISGDMYINATGEHGFTVTCH